MLAHQKTKSVEMAAQMVNKDLEWAQTFLKSPKFRKFVYSKMAQFSAQNGLTVEWWYAFGKQLTEGYSEHYEYRCEFCEFQGTMNNYEAETYRDDDMQFKASCQSCYKPITLNFVKEKFLPSREQVEGWKELGSRLIPKIERIHHQFSNEEIIFESTGGER